MSATHPPHLTILAVALGLILLIPAAWADPVPEAVQPAWEDPWDTHDARGPLLDEPAVSPQGVYPDPLLDGPHLPLRPRDYRDHVPGLRLRGRDFPVPDARLRDLQGQEGWADVYPRVAPDPEAEIRFDRRGLLTGAERRRWGLDSERKRALAEKRAEYGWDSTLERLARMFRRNHDSGTGWWRYERRETDGRWRRVWPEDGSPGPRYRPRPDRELDDTLRRLYERDFPGGLDGGAVPVPDPGVIPGDEGVPGGPRIRGASV